MIYPWSFSVILAQHHECPGDSMSPPCCPAAETRKHLQGFLDATSEDLVFNRVQLSPSTLTNEQLCAKKIALLEPVTDHATGRLRDLETSPILKAMQIFFMVNIPESEADLAVYGEEQITTLCEYFQGHLERMDCQVDAIQAEWTALKAHMSIQETVH